MKRKFKSLYEAREFKKAVTNFANNLYTQKVKNNSGSNPKTQKLPIPLKIFLGKNIQYVIDMCIADSGNIQWYYDDFIMDENGFITLETLDENWKKDEVSQHLDPKGLYDDFVDYFRDQQNNIKDLIREYINTLVFNYFGGDTDASWEDYADPEEYAEDEEYE